MSILARRKTRIDRDKNLAVLRAKTRTNILKKKPRNFRKAESFVLEYLRAERDSNRIKRQVLVKREFSAQLPKNSKLLLVMRHRTKKVASPQIRKIFKQLRLSTKSSTVFVQNTPKIAAMLPIIEPYVVYGTPNINLVRDLIFKNGKMVVEGKKTGIQSNVVIEKEMGDMGIICVEDIIHAIVSCGDNFEEVNSKILPFHVC